MDKRKKEYKQTQEYKAEIAAWLESEEKDFDAGFELFARFSHNRALAMQLARLRRQSKLEYELQKIANREFLKESRVWPIAKVQKAAARNEEHTETETQVEKTGKKLVVIDEKINYDDLPEDLKKLYDENREKYKIMRSLHEKMKLATKDQERADLRAELVKLDDVIAKNWEKLDKWEEDGRPETEDGSEKEDGSGKPEAGSEEEDESQKSEDRSEEKKADPMEVGKELNACRSYLSRNVKKLAGLEGKKRDALMAKLDERVKTLQKHNAEIKDSTRKELVELGLIDD